MLPQLVQQGSNVINKETQKVEVAAPKSIADIVRRKVTQKAV